MGIRYIQYNNHIYVQRISIQFWVSYFKKVITF